MRAPGQARHHEPDRDPRRRPRRRRRRTVEREFADSRLRRLQDRGRRGGRRVAARRCASATRSCARDEAELERILAAGAEKARAMAAETLADVARARWGSGPSPRPSLSAIARPRPSPSSSSTSTSSRDRSTSCSRSSCARSSTCSRSTLAEIVLAYLDHLEARDELDLETATEFLVLIAALLELKSRLMLPGEEVEELDELAPAEAAEELLERLLRTRASAPPPSHLAERHAHGQALLLPLRAAAERAAPRAGRARRGGPTTRPSLGAALGGLLRTPPPIDLATWRCRASRWASGSPTCASCCAAARSLRRGGQGRRPRHRRASRCSRCSSSTSAARPSWEQAEPFGAITVARPASAWIAGVTRSPASLEALLFLAPEPVSLEELADACRAASRRSREALRELRDGLDGRGVVLQASRRRLRAGLAPGRRGGRAAAARRARARPRSRRRRPRRCRSSPTCSRSRARRSPASAASRSESATSALAERGLIEEAGRSPVRRRPLPHHPAVPEAVRPATRSRSCPSSRSGTRAPRRPGGAARSPAARRRRAHRHAPLAPPRPLG